MRHRTRLASYLVSITDNSLLLARIASGYPGEGAWTLPGGGIKWGEHPEAALRREVFEEAGLRLADAAFLGIDSRVYAESADRPALHAVRFLYTHPLTGNPRVTEVDGSVDAADWIPITNLSEIRTVQLVSVGLQMYGDHP